MLGRTGAARMAAPWTAGAGAILMFHHVRPHQPRPFEPNRILEITPEFLDTVIAHTRSRGYDVIALGDVPDRLRRPRGRFIALTFDDGYRDNLVHALPVLEKHQAPFTVFVTTGFADRTTTMWWNDLEEALVRLPEVDFGGQRLNLATPARKQTAFNSILAGLRQLPGPELHRFIAELAARAGVDAAARVDRYCLDWTEIRAMDRLALCTIGAHTVSHPLLATHAPEVALREITDSKRRLEEMLGHPVHHFAYPVGDPGAAGPREFAMARETGFTTAATTRPGVLFREHAQHLHALPRLSVNGLYQSVHDFDVLLSGAAFALFNRGRKVNAA
jgi:peptidoglycan/xylan/chitin deacetylase (PgdA/CDA1 family)